MSVRTALDAALAGTPDRVSVCLGGLGTRPHYARLPDERHYAASMMKVAVLVAVYRAVEAGPLELGTPVPVVNDFASALGDGSRYANDRDYDDEQDVWACLGGTAPLGWLARRMIVRSSNLATNLLIAQVGRSAVAEVWRLAAATGSVTMRGIEDYAARDARIDNVVTAADLAAMLGAIALGAREPDRTTGRIAGRRACAEMLDLLAAQEHRVDLGAGLPGVRVAHKNGWMTGVRHSAGVVFPDDAPPYVIAVCTSAARDPEHYDDGAACRLIARLSRIAWDARKELVA
jgi:beta-lactamase class A